MSGAKCLHWVSVWGKSGFYVHGYWPLVPVVVTRQWIISTICQVWPNFQSCIAWWVYWRSRPPWHSLFWIVIGTTVSNQSGFGPEKLFGSVPNPSKTPTRFDLAGLLPGWDINLRLFGRIEPGPQFHFTVPATLASMKYLSTDCIVTWSIHR